MQLFVVRDCSLIVIYQLPDLFGEAWNVRSTVIMNTQELL